MLVCHKISQTVYVHYLYNHVDTNKFSGDSRFDFDLAVDGLFVQA